MSRRSVPVGTGSMFLNDDDEDWLILAASRLFVPDRKRKKLATNRIWACPHAILKLQQFVRPLLQSRLTGTLLFAMASGLPPLPPGWTQHTAQTGHKYYYHASTKKSTYKRPTDTAQQTPPTPPPAIEQPPIKNTALLVSKEQAVPLTEWASEMSVEPTYSQERSTARIMPNEMWKKLEDRPRKK